MAEMKTRATRDSYGETVAALAQEYNNLVVLDADLAAATKTAVFKKACPERFFDCGIAEQNMVGVAAGLATTGKVVFASSFAMFASGRAFEQVRNSVAYPKLNVKIAATHAGISVGEDGATHQCCEDISLMRTIPNMVVINPADDAEACAAVRAAAAYDGPVYLRFGRLAAEPLFDPDTYSFEIGKGVTLKQGDDITIVATGLMVAEAVKACALLEQQGIQARLLNIHTIKPIDKELLVQAARETGRIVTVEEHNVIGGLGSAVLEAISDTAPVPVTRIGVQDTFGRSGPAKELLVHYGLTADNIAKTVKEALGK